MNLLADRIISTRIGLQRVTLLKILCALTFFSAFSPALLLAETGVTQTNAVLGWNTNSDAGFGGYFIYVGGVSGTYTNRMDAGASTEVSVDGLTPGVTYFFVVTAYLRDGTESAFSNELAVKPGSAGPLGVTLSIAINAAGVPIISGQGVQNHSYAFEATSDFTSWTTLTNGLADSSGNFNFEDTSPLPPVRAYRVKDLTQTPASLAAFPFALGSQILHLARDSQQ